MLTHHLDTVTSAPFAQRLGTPLTVEAADGELVVEVFGVRERPLSAGPNAKRTPFSVTLRGPDTPYLPDGCFDLRAEGEDGWRLQGVYINRIMPCASSDGTGAFYQLAIG